MTHDLIQGSQAWLEARLGRVTASRVADVVARTKAGYGASRASYMAGQYAQPRLRVPEVTIDPAANPSIWPAALGIKFGDRARWHRRTSPGVLLTVDGFVDSIVYDVEPGKFRVKVRINPGPTFQPGLVGDPVYGLIGSTLLSTY